MHGHVKHRAEPHSPEPRKVSETFSCLRCRSLNWDSLDALGKGQFQKKPDIESNTISAQRESRWLPMGLVLKFFHIG